MAFSLLAGTFSDSACAYIDEDNTLDPESAAAAGVNLRNLFWVRIAGAGAKQIYPASVDPFARSVTLKITAWVLSWGAA